MRDKLLKPVRNVFVDRYSTPEINLHLQLKEFIYRIYFDIDKKRKYALTK